MLALVEAQLSYCFRISQLADEGKASIGLIGRAKAIVSKIGREVVQLAREVCGGNGILLENRVMKCFMDMEAVYTYEGTYDINMLVAGRELTGGIAAFKMK